MKAVDGFLPKRGREDLLSKGIPLISSQKDETMHCNTRGLRLQLYDFVQWRYIPCPVNVPFPADAVPVACSLIYLSCWLSKSGQRFALVEQSH